MQSHRPGAGGPHFLLSPSEGAPLTNRQVRHHHILPRGVGGGTHRQELHWEGLSSERPGAIQRPRREGAAAKGSRPGLGAGTRALGRQAGGRPGSR